MSQLYIDNNVYRLLKKDVGFQKSFVAFLNKERPLLLDNANIIFTWSQLFEDINLGKIITKIKEEDSSNFKNKIRNILTLNNISTLKNFSSVFKEIHNIVMKLPEFQKDSILEAINDPKGHFKYSDEENSPERFFLINLFESTLQKAKIFIENSEDNDYITEIANEITWRIFIAHNFIQNTKSWNQSNNYYFDSMISLHHKMYLKGYRLELFPLLEKCYYSYTNHSSSEKFDPLQHKPLKQESDLCDGELIDFVSLGCEQKPVIAITLSHKDLFKKSINLHEKRLAIMKQSLIDLKRCIKEWNINPIPGEILILSQEKNVVIAAHSIHFNAPFNESLS